MSSYTVDLRVWFTVYNTLLTVDMSQVNMSTKVYSVCAYIFKICVYLLYCIGVKLGISHRGRNKG